MMKQYRIGDFAKYLGVTPDFLKHYEDLGLIQSVRSDSGYRYYPFHETMLLIETVRLRNFGMTLREIGEILKQHAVESAQVNRRLAENMDHLRQEMLLDEAVIEEYESFLEWKAPLETQSCDWEIRRSRPAFFLPHTDSDDFLHDPRIYELLRDWMSFIPIVKPCMMVHGDGQIVVEYLPSRKVFYYKFRGPLIKMKDETNVETHPAITLLHSLGLERSGAYFRVTLMPADWEQDIGSQYGFYAIPLLDRCSE